MRAWEGAELNRAKDILAYEVTKIVHGEEEANKALSAAKAMFGGSGDESAIPHTELAESELGDGINIVVLLEKAGLIASRGEGRRLITQGGIKAGGKTISSFDYTVTPGEFSDGQLLIQKGKKVYHKIIRVS